MTMINPSLSLRHLPAEIEPVQALFLDGIRHAADLSSLAYSRLQTSLESIARLRHRGDQSGDVTEPFLYAWAFVDSIDRLRLLTKLAPGFETRPRADGKLGFLAQTEDIRDVRNVSDHLGQRAAYVVKHSGAALGILQWVTPLSRNAVLSCSIRPGRLRSALLPLVTPPDRELENADCIVLSAGEHSADLSRARVEAARITQNIEKGLEEWTSTAGLPLTAAPADIVAVAELRFETLAEVSNRGDG